MKLLYQTLKFHFRIICRAVRAFRCKIISGHISPEIYPALSSLLRNHPGRTKSSCRTTLHKFIGRHQLNRIDPQFLPVGNHLLQHLKCSLHAFNIAIRLCITTHMQFIKDHLMIRNFRTLISFPVKFLILQESTAHFMRIPVHRDSETFPAINSVRTGIRINLSVHQKIIFVILRIKFRKCKCTDISHSVLFCKRNLHRRFSRSLLIKSQRCTDPFRHLHCKIIASRKLICTRH